MLTLDPMSTPEKFEIYGFNGDYPFGLNGTYQFANGELTLTLATNIVVKLTKRVAKPQPANPPLPRSDDVLELGPNNQFFAP